MSMEFNETYFFKVVPARVERLCRAHACGDTRDVRERAYCAAVKRFERNARRERKAELDDKRI